jgi:large subunit ribosomal protein L17
MVTSFFKYEKIETTTHKAKEIKKIAEKILTHAKKGGLHKIRLVYKIIKDKGILKKLFKVIAPKYANRNGGYTSIVKTRIRKGDGASLSIIKLV